MSVGEMGSIVHLLIALKRKKRVLHHVSTLSDSWHWETVNELLSLSLPMTGSRLIGSFDKLSEPMCLVLSAGVLLQQQLITTYGQLNGYVMPLLTLPSFATIALSNWLLPSFTLIPGQPSPHGPCPQTILSDRLVLSGHRLPAD